MSNKKNGNDFKIEFSQLAGKLGFWVYLPPENNIQPADAILIKNGLATLVDCKVCEKNIFFLSRIEKNHELEMKKWLYLGNTRAVFALNVNSNIWMIPFNILSIYKETGDIQFDLPQIQKFGKQFNDWSADFNTY